MKQRFFTLLFSLAATLLPLNAQNSYNIIDRCGDIARDFGEWCRKNNVADHLSVGLNIGSTGLGLEVITPVTRWVNLRAGVDWLPHFGVPMTFDINTFTDGMPSGNFQEVQGLLYDLTGMEIDSKVTMNGTADMVNFKLLADIYPFQNNRHWHFTAGFYVGTATIAKAKNDRDEMPDLVALNIYNRAYNYFTTLENIYDVPLGGGIYMEPERVQYLQQRFRAYGHMGIHIGNFKDGTPYIMEPAPDGTVSAKAIVNHFKPYLGAGYSTSLDKSKRWNFSVDVGVLFWGGAPKVINHDYTTGRDINFTKDLIDIRGKAGDYINIVKALPVYPSLTLKFSYDIL